MQHNYAVCKKKREKTPPVFSALNLIDRKLKLYQQHLHDLPESESKLCFLSSPIRIERESQAHR